MAIAIDPDQSYSDCAGADRDGLAYRAEIEPHMSVFSEVAAALGVPGWGVAISSGIVLLAKQVDGSMRPEAKAVIGEFLDQGRIPTEAPSVTNAVCAAFRATFGERQWSWRCTRRTLLLSMFTVYSICLLIWSKHGGEIRGRMPGLPSLPAMIASSLIGVVLFSLTLTLYVGKTRLILRGMSNLRGFYGLFAFMLLDLLLTYSINMVFYWGPNMALFGLTNLCDTTRYYHPNADCTAFDNPAGVLAGIVGISAAMTERIWSQAGSLTPGNILNYAEGCTTLLTSIWTVLIVIAMAMLRLLSPLARVRRFVRWGWDVRENAVMALGWMMAVLVFLSSRVYAIV